VWKLTARRLPPRARHTYDAGRNYRACRQITRLCDNGHQTTIVATRTDEPGWLA